MCGLVGMVGDLSYSDERTMDKLLTFDYFRGKDSTGLATISWPEQEGHIAKVVGSPMDLFETQSCCYCRRGYEGDCSSILFWPYHGYAQWDSINCFKESFGSHCR